jgi:hypothetical protein
VLDPRARRATYPPARRWRPRSRPGTGWPWPPSAAAARSKSPDRLWAQRLAGEPAQDLVGVLTSVAELVAAIGRFCAGWNQRCQPFIWTKDADQMREQRDDPRTLEDESTTTQSTAPPTSESTLPPTSESTLPPTSESTLPPASS